MIWFASLLFICNEINNKLYIVKNLGWITSTSYVNAYEDRMPVDAHLKLKLMHVHSTDKLPEETESVSRKVQLLPAPCEVI